MHTELLQWFRKAGRELPWRKDYSPYSVWVAETMLCQTQVGRVIPRYFLWMRRFPDIFALAEAPLGELLRVWEGLGYYARPRYMRKTAEKVVETFQGEFPKDYNILRGLPGIGHYTACAILSIAYNLPYPAIDGNASRVFARLLDLSLPVETRKAQKMVFDFALSLIRKGEARLVNQAIMDLGALICVPRSPRCSFCPVRQYCLAFQRNTQIIRPVRRVRSLKSAEAVVVFCHRDGQVLIRRRPEGGFLGGLWEFPWKENASPDELIPKDFRDRDSVPELIGEIFHTYCQRRIKARIFFIDVNRETFSSEEYHWEEVNRLDEYPFSSFHRKALRLFREFMVQRRVKET
ncbi:MAG: A/G-specific adenine glycosylase [Candidatus Atribacteria bacterium]|nr:A/G-specific adenine glycosylase [Candidatus Atribacteria bacterium]